MDASVAAPYSLTMAWLLETVIEAVIQATWFEGVLAAYKRRGWLAAAAVFLAPFLVLGLLGALIYWALLS